MHSRGLEFWGCQQSLDRTGRLDWTTGLAKFDHKTTRNEFSSLRMASHRSYLITPLLIPQGFAV